MLVLHVRQSIVTLDLNARWILVSRGLAAPKAASSSVSRYSRTARGVSLGQFFGGPIGLWRCFLAIRIGGITLTTRELDLSRFSAAPSARLSHPSFKNDRAFPAQC
jgi:hypothetical protein